MNLIIDENILKTFNKKDLKVFFYESWCEKTKINISDDFEKNWLESFVLWEKNIFFEEKDKNFLIDWKIILNQNGKYLFLSPKVKKRCSCASSFSFENNLISQKHLKDLSKIKNIFNKN